MDSLLHYLRPVADPLGPPAPEPRSAAPPHDEQSNSSSEPNDGITDHFVAEVLEVTTNLVEYPVRGVLITPRTRHFWRNRWVVEYTTHAPKAMSWDSQRLVPTTRPILPSTSWTQLASGDRARCMMVFMQQNPALEHYMGELRRLLPGLSEKYYVKTLEVFGSYVRNEQSAESDFDILVTFEKTPSLLTFIELEYYLSDCLGLKVHLGMKDSLNPRIKQRVLQEAIPV